MSEQWLFQPVFKQGPDGEIWPMAVVVRRADSSVPTEAEAVDWLRSMGAWAASEPHASEYADSIPAWRELARLIEAGEIPVLGELPPGAERVEP